MRLDKTSLAASLQLLGLVAASPVPQSYGSGGEDSAARAATVVSAFKTGFTGYETYAFGYDELLPISNGKSNSFGGWGATAVDALDTAIIMGVPDIVEKILDYIPTINFAKPADNAQISLFETTIRYIGGFLAAYDLLKGPAANMAPSDSSKVDALLTQATYLANNLSYAFNTSTGIPHNGLFLNNQTTTTDTTNGLATIGTLVLEWTRLSDLTGDQTYTQLTQKAESYLLSPKPASSEPWPGLVGTNVDIATGLFQDASGGWQGGDDSFYEYLIKMYVYDNTRFGAYKDRWVLAADSTIAHLTSHPSTRPDLTFVAEFNGQNLSLNSQHLACFDGGNFILGGLVLGEQKYIDYGLQLVAGCEDTYNQTATGIGPDGFSWDPNNVPADQQAFFEKAGYYITGSAYILRPEVLESFYYAYIVTGDQKYRDWSWNGISAILNNTRTGSGFAELQNVNVVGGGGFNDFQDSFFFAEVLKYAYLIHAPDADYQVKNSKDQLFVFNTEAHPVKVAKVL
ncbi:glycoside hydrolase family 47 protein [Myriangium duriaei CBS 260.36]|uniref:alpha-1,2-Mannosidase n=1 Tax=Myriangium duriaei CBS 260.36 TaxID=1168546 RepID=A0A9P4J0C4_9PEZI|nr:glycoside hydrolase family 47 protein [Myriangium duriaei CBS 260.36]